MNWKERYKQSGLMKDMFGGMFKSNLKDPSQCKHCGEDFSDGKNPKQKVNMNNTFFQDGPLSGNYVERSSNNDEACTSCEVKNR